MLTTNPIANNLRHENGWPVHSHNLKAAFGLTEWPREGGVTERWIGNVLVWVEPPKGGYAKHRAMCRCPECWETIPAGRLHQHLGTARCNEAMEKGVSK